MSILKIFIGCSNQAKVDKVIGKSKKKDVLVFTDLCDDVFTVHRRLSRSLIFTLSPA